MASRNTPPCSRDTNRHSKFEFECCHVNLFLSPNFEVGSKLDLKDCDQAKAQLQTNGEDFVDIEEAEKLIAKHDDVVAVIENSSLQKIAVPFIFHLGKNFY